MWRFLPVMAVLLGFIAPADQGPGMDAVMRRKLDETQKILEGIVVSDWTAVERHAEALERLTNDPRWMALRYPEYVRYSDQFRRTLQALHSAARRRDLDETPKAYTALTLQCVACHRYLARSRIAQ